LIPDQISFQLECDLLPDRPGASVRARVRARHTGKPTGSPENQLDYRKTNLEQLALKPNTMQHPEAVVTCVPY